MLYWRQVCKHTDSIAGCNPGCADAGPSCSGVGASSQFTCRRHPRPSSAWERSGSYVHKYIPRQPGRAGANPSCSAVGASGRKRPNRMPSSSPAVERMGMKRQLCTCHGSCPGSWLRYIHTCGRSEGVRNAGGRTCISKEQQRCNLLPGALHKDRVAWLPAPRAALAQARRAISNL